MASNFLTGLAIAFVCFSEGSPGLFGYYAFVTSLGFFLPVLDLGIGQAIYNHFSSRKTDEFSTQDFNYYVKYLGIISIFWIVLVSAFYIIDRAIELRAENRSSLSLNTGLIAISLIIYFISIPFSAGFKLLNSIPRIEISLLLQSITSPLVLLSLILGRATQTEFRALVFLAPPLSFLLSNLIAFFIAKKHLVLRKSELSVDTRRPSDLFLFGSWSTLLTLASLLITFLPRLVLQVNDEMQMLDNYSFFLTVLTPFLSIISLYAMKVNPDFRKLVKELKLNWLISRVKESLVLATLISVVLLVLVTFLRKTALPTLSMPETFLAIILIYLYAIFFVPLSAQTNLEDIKRFCILYIFVIALQISIVFALPNQSYLIFLLTTITFSFFLQCFGVILITLHVLKGKNLKLQK